MSAENLTSKENLTVLVNTCDAYQDIWPMFFSALEEYWPDRKANIVLNTETKSPDFTMDGLKVHNFKDKSGYDKWGLRLIKTLQSIETEYVVVVYDDFILESKFDSDKLNTLVNYMDSDKNIAVFYLISIGLPTTSFKRYDEQELILDRMDYRLNSAPALWRREDLIKYTGSSDTPWAWEVFGSYRTYNDGKLFFAPIRPEYDIYKYNYKKGGAIYRGKWVPEVVIPKKEKYGLDLDFSFRGFADQNISERRSFIWKLKFILLGFKMVRFKVFYFPLYYLKAKFK